LTTYFGVVGNRDYIKLHGERLPFWAFLDTPPDGWLCSLAYVREDVPTDRQRLWDCGAWSYKDLDEPKIKRDLVTAQWAFEQYSKLGKANDLVVAPDHMLLPGKDLDARRRFNRQSAENFLQLAEGSQLVPVAGVHGDSTEERVEHAGELLHMGYRHLALGGLAGRASQKKAVTAIVATLVKAIRSEAEGVWIHVLGLSAPYYYREWRRIGIDSCDGASQFKQAFSGTFYVEEGGKLKEHQAVKPGLEPVAPHCECRACDLLRGDNIDTRTYGSNQHNMGRAAHNLNMLIRAHQHIKAGDDELDNATQERLDLPVAIRPAQPVHRG
jgi:hypothetical protein